MKDKPTFEIFNYVTDEEIDATLDRNKAREYFKQGHKVVESRIKHIRWSKKVTVVILVAREW